MKRATLLLEDSLYDRAKRIGRERGLSLKEVINELLREGMNVLATSKKPLSIPVHKKSGPRAGINIADRDSLYDLMDD